MKKSANKNKSKQAPEDLIVAAPARPLPEMTAEVKELWKRHRGGDKSARKELVEKYFPLVEVNSQNIVETILAAIDDRDFHQAAVIGFLESVDEFDEAYGMPFEEFSSLKIRDAIIEELANFIRE